MSNIADVVRSALDAEHVRDGRHDSNESAHGDEDDAQHDQSESNIDDLDHRQPRRNSAEMDEEMHERVSNPSRSSSPKASQHHKSPSSTNGHAQPNGQHARRKSQTIDEGTSGGADTSSPQKAPSRSISFSQIYTPTFSKPRHGVSLTFENSDAYEGELKPPDAPPEFRRLESDFRGALEYNNPEQREKEREMAEKRERQRLNKLSEDYYWNPLKWFGMEPTQQSPVEEEDSADGGYFDFFKSEKGKGRAKEETNDETHENGVAIRNGSAVHSAIPEEDEEDQASPSSPRPPVSRHRSLPQIRGQSSRRNSFARTPGWARLRARLPDLLHRKEVDRPGQTVIPPHVVNITDELIMGGLAAMMPKLWIERDEHGNRRVPVLLHRLRVRISDSLFPTKEKKAVFRIECEYANGASRWVIYRRLSDFVKLHGRYKASNYLHRNVEGLPELPRTSEFFLPL